MDDKTNLRIRHIQQVIGTKDDGIWGNASKNAVKEHLRKLMPKNNPWPKSDYNSMVAFYGQPGDESNLVKIVFPFDTFYDGQKVKTTRVHKRCAESLLRVLNDIKSRFAHDPSILEAAADYGGCYFFRNKRGSSSLSMHAWGAAIDMDDDDNTFTDPWPEVSDMPIEVMECFAREGWLSGGAFWGKDSMHHQATQ